MTTAATAIAWGLATSPAAAETTMASGAVLTNTCFSCHGTDGHSVGGMPTIAGKTKNFIADRLKAFKADKLEPTVMNRIAKGFSDTEIEAIADYFAKK
jgi:sulfide dehydrogenase cytochrome subunit